MTQRGESLFRGRRPRCLGKCVLYFSVWLLLSCVCVVCVCGSQAAACWVYGVIESTCLATAFLMLFKVAGYFIFVCLIMLSRTG